MGFRVIKTALATLAAIYTAAALGLPNPFSAGLLAILGVDRTRWSGLRSVFARFMASAAGLLLASLLFQAIGFYIWVLSLYILIAFPLLSRLGLSAGIITGSVVVFHLFARGEVTVAAIAVELQFLIIGLGWATIFNLIYMPKEHNKLEELRKLTEEGFADVFHHLAIHLRNPDTVWAGEEMLRTESAIERGIKAAKRAQENRLIPQDEPWLLYFHMRRGQWESIQLMMESVAFISRNVSQAELIALLFDRLELDVKSEFYEGETERMLNSLERGFHAMPLPASREEFETRAALLHLVRELQRYLAIARREKKPKSTSAHAVIE